MSKYITKRDMGIHYEECPFCFTELQGTYCKQCNTVYSFNALEHQELWGHLSLELAETSEKNPLICNITIEPEESMGLSSLDLPTIDKLFQHSDGTMWYHLYGTLTDEWHDLDECENEVLKQILGEIDENY